MSDDSDSRIDQSGWLVAHGLAKSFGKKTVVHDVSIAVRRGEFDYYQQGSALSAERFIPALDAVIQVMLEVSKLAAALLRVVEIARELGIPLGDPLLVDLSVGRAARLLFAGPIRVIEPIALVLQALHEQPGPVAIGGRRKILREQGDLGDALLIARPRG